MNPVETPGWIKSDAADVLLSLHVQPAAKRTAITGLYGDNERALKLKLAAPAVDGKANAALIAYLGKSLQLPKSRIEIIHGQTHRDKRVRITGVSVGEVKIALNKLLL